MMKTLSKSEIKELQEQIKSAYNVEILDKKDLIQINTDNKFVYVNKELSFFYVEDRIVPTLKLILKNNFLKKITVDMGAVKFMASGADVMRPGIIEIEDGINAENFIVVQDINNKKPLAIGQSLYNSEEMRSLTTGKVVKNIHHVGDEIWKA